MMVQPSVNEEYIAYNVTELLFQILKISKTWYEDDECYKAYRRILKLAEKLDTIQYEVDIAFISSGGIGIGSGILGTIGFGLLFGGPTAFAGVILLAISSGTGAIGTFTEIIAKLHNWRKRKKFKTIAIDELTSRANISYKQMIELGKKFDSIVSIVAKFLESRHNFPTNDHSWKDVATVCILCFFNDILESYADICKQVYNENDIDIYSLKLNIGKLKNLNKHFSRIKVIWSEYVSHINQIWDYVQPVMACNTIGDLIDKALDAAQILKAIKLGSSAGKTAEVFIHTGDILSDAATLITGPASNIDIIADTSVAFKNSAYVADSAGDASASIGTFASLSKSGQVMASIGCFFNILSIGLGSYQIHSAVKNMHANKTEHQAASKEGKKMRQCVNIIKIGLFVRINK